MHVDLVDHHTWVWPYVWYHPRVVRTGCTRNCRYRMDDVCSSCGSELIFLDPTQPLTRILILFRWIRLYLDVEHQRVPLGNPLISFSWSCDPTGLNPLQLWEYGPERSASAIILSFQPPPPPVFSASRPVFSASNSRILSTISPQLILEGLFWGGAGGAATY